MSHKEELKRIQIELVRQVLDGEKTENRIPHARPACIQGILTELTGNNVIHKYFLEKFM